LPEPLVPEVIVIHDALVVADQEQPATADTVILCEPPLGPNPALVGETS
jgi:hypothetical protein